MSIRILEAEPHNIFQQVACDLPYDKLPLNREVIGRILKIRIQKIVELDKTESQVRITDIIKQVADETIAVWDRASIPTKRKDKVLVQINKLWGEMDFVRKGGGSHTWKETAGGQLRTKLDSLCDIASAVKQPEHPEDVSFLEDQRSARRMTIGPIDPATTERWRRRMARQARRAAIEPARRANSARSSAPPNSSPAVLGPRSAARAAARGIRSVTLDGMVKNGSDGPIHAAAAASVTAATGLCPITAAAGSASETSPSASAGPSTAGSSAFIASFTGPDVARQSTASATISTTREDPDFFPPPPRGNRKPDLSSLAEAVDEAGTSSRKGAALLSTQQGSVVTRSKLRTAINRTREGKLRAIAERTAACTAVFSDGRNDKTLIQPQTGSPRLITVTAHNVSVNMHPGDVFVGHFAAEGRHTGEHVAQQLVAFLHERGVNVEQVTTVGGDGTNQVIGSKGGWMARMEARLGRPLTRVVCLCHHLELPFRKLFCHLDGQTTGPGTFEGPIGRELSGPVHELPVADFTAIQCSDWIELPVAVERELSSDLKLLYRCAKSVSEGDASSVRGLAHGKVHHARWYTAQSRLLRLYMATDAPTPQLAALAQYVVCVYVPMVVQVKHRWDVVHAARHITEELRRQRAHVSSDLLRVVQRSVTDNALMAHPESILLGMLSDPSSEVRAEAVGLLTRAREALDTGTIRRYAVARHEVNVNADSYLELHTGMEMIRCDKYSYIDTFYLSCEYV